MFLPLCVCVCVCVWLCFVLFFHLHEQRGVQLAFKAFMSADTVTDGSASQIALITHTHTHTHTCQGQITFIPHTHTHTHPHTHTHVGDRGNVKYEQIHSGQQRLLLCK